MGTSPREPIVWFGVARRRAGRLQQEAVRAGWYARSFTQVRTSWRDRPVLFVIAQPRTGSYLLLDLLSQDSRVISVDEPLNPDRHPTLDLHAPRVARAHLDHELATPFADDHRPSLVVAKLFIGQLQLARLSTQELVRRYPTARFVVLYRRSLLDQFVSLKTADRTGQWRSTDPSTGETPDDVRLTFTGGELRAYADAQRCHYANLARQLANRGDWLAYEDLTTDLAAPDRSSLEATISGLTGCQPRRIDEPGLRRQRTRSLDDIVPDLGQILPDPNVSWLWLGDPSLPTGERSPRSWRIAGPTASVRAGVAAGRDFANELPWKVRSRRLDRSAWTDRRVLFLLSEPRSGTHLLRDYLAQQEGWSIDEELIDPSNHERALVCSPGDARLLLDRTLAALDGDVVGGGIMLGHLHHFRLSIGEVQRRYANARFVVLWRSSLLDQYVSHRTAQTTGVWVRPVGVGVGVGVADSGAAGASGLTGATNTTDSLASDSPMIAVSAPELRRYCDDRKRAHHRVRQQLGDTAAWVRYEDLIHNPGAHLGQVLAPHVDDWTAHGFRIVAPPSVARLARRPAIERIVDAPAVVPDPDAPWLWL